MLSENISQAKCDLWKYYTTQGAVWALMNIYNGALEYTLAVILFFFYLFVSSLGVFHHTARAGKTFNAVV